MTNYKLKISNIVFFSTVDFKTVFTAEQIKPLGAATYTDPLSLMSC